MKHQVQLWKMVGDLGVARKPEDVEADICKLGSATLRPAALPQGMDAGAELLQRVRQPARRQTLRVVEPLAQPSLEDER